MQTISAATARDYVADALRAALPEAWTVKNYPYTPTQVYRDKPVAAVWRTDIAPGGVTLAHTITIHVYGARVEGAAGEDEFDALHDVVAEILENLGGFVWKTSARANFADQTIGGWTISGDLATKNTYRTAI